MDHPEPLHEQWTAIDDPTYSSYVWSPIDHPLRTGLVSGLLIFVVSFALDTILVRLRFCGPLVMAAISDSILAIVCFALISRMLQQGKERKRQVVERLATIDEMNHHVRNALQIISFNARAASCNEHELSEIKEAVQRINWSLREILPKLEPEFRPFEGSARDQNPPKQDSSAASQTGSTQTGC
jgi:hypothetical protein